MARVEAATDAGTAVVTLREPNEYGDFGISMYVWEKVGVGCEGHFMRVGSDIDAGFRWS